MSEEITREYVLDFMTHDDDLNQCFEFRKIGLFCLKFISFVEFSLTSKYKYAKMSDGKLIRFRSIENLDNNFANLISTSYDRIKDCEEIIAEMTNDVVLVMHDILRTQDEEMAQKISIENIHMLTFFLQEVDGSTEIIQESSNFLTISDLIFHFNR